MKGEAIPRWPAFEQSTRPFRTLYQEVTQRLHVRKLGLAKEEERQWMQFLIDRFELEYQLWAEKPELRPYLELSDRCILSNPLLSVLAHAYLHVCYDLPRVIADSFTILEPRRAQKIYRDLRGDFSEVFANALANPTVFGSYSYPWKLVRWLLPNNSLAVAGVLNNWLLTRRSEAWLNALTLHEESPIRLKLEAHMIGHLEATARNVMELTRNPVQWCFLSHDGAYRSAGRGEVSGNGKPME